MKILKRTRRVTVEIERTFVFRSRSRRKTVWCVQCGMEVEMVDVELAAQEANLSELTIYQLIEWGVLHFAEDVDRRVLVCLNPLRQ